MLRIGLAMLIVGSMVALSATPATAAPSSPSETTRPPPQGQTEIAYCQTHLCITNVQVTSVPRAGGTFNINVTFKTTLPAKGFSEIAHVFAFDADGTFDDPNYTLVSNDIKTSHSFTFTGGDFVQGKTFYYLVGATHAPSGATAIKAGQVPAP